jgi:Zn-dependent peptidase ImmA (M78 family)/transcriptional regulator with XRE-family HTH domain
MRDILGISQGDLAMMIGTTQSGVASMEAGLYRPSSEYLKTIAQYTGFSIAFFEKEETADFPVGSILYRSLVSVKPTARGKAHAIAQAAFELASILASKLKRIPINIPRLDDEPAMCAKIARATLGLSPNTPIRGLLRCLERNGVLIFSLPLEIEGLDGFSVWAGNDPVRPVFALLQGKTAYREVFTAAEEFAHLVMHFPLRGLAAKDADQQAREFAREFLLPAEAMLSEMQKPVTLSSLAAMKSRWGVSISFLAKRAETLELISRNQHRYLIQQMHSNWGTKSEPGDEHVIPEKPSMVRKMAEMLYGNPIDVGRLTKDAGLPHTLIRDLLGIEPTQGRLLEFKKS